MKAYVGMGSNVGDREAMIKSALEALAELPETSLLRTSSLYDSEPVGDADQPNFLNAVAELDTELSPHQLLWNLLLVERRLGRVRTRHWGPRSIDLDLLLHGPLVIDEPDLKVPHPELLTRAFVLVPLVELDPLLEHPVTHESLVAHLSRLPARPPLKRGTHL